MRYSEQLSRPSHLGCLPAFVFGLVVVIPAAFGIMMGECFTQDGSIGACPNRGVELLTVALVTAALCSLITWATNELVRALVAQGRSAFLGVAAGFALSAVLLGLGYIGLMAWR